MTSCPSDGEDTYRIWFNNNSEQDIAVYVGSGKSGGHTLYPVQCFQKRLITLTKYQNSVSIILMNLILKEA